MLGRQPPFPAYKPFRECVVIVAYPRNMDGFIDRQAYICC